MPRTNKPRMVAIPEDELQDDAKYLRQFAFLELKDEVTGLEAYRSWRRLAKTTASGPGKIAPLMVQPVEPVISVEPTIIETPTIEPSPTPALDPTVNMREFYTAEMWANNRQNAGTRQARWQSLRRICLSRGQHFSETEKDKIAEYVTTNLLMGILSGKESPYEIGKKAKEWLQPKYSPAVTSKAVQDFRALCDINAVVSPRFNISKERWNIIVSPPPMIREREKGNLTIEMFRVLVNDTSVHTDLEDRAIYEMCGLTGGRIQEVLSLKWKHIDFGKKVSGVTLAIFEKQKTSHGLKIPTYRPISRELISILDKLHKGKRDPDTRLFGKSYDVVGWRFNQVMKAHGFTEFKQWEREDMEYSKDRQVAHGAWSITVHNLRQFAQAFAHDCGMSDDEAAMLVGRKAGSAKSTTDYLGVIGNIAPIWQAKVEPHTNFLTIDLAADPIMAASEKVVGPKNAGFPVAETISMAEVPSIPLHATSSGISSSPPPLASLKQPDPVSIIPAKYHRCEEGCGRTHFLKGDDRCTYKDQQLTPGIVKEIVDNGVQEIKEVVQSKRLVGSSYKGTKLEPDKFKCDTCGKYFPPGTHDSCKVSNSLADWMA